MKEYGLAAILTLAASCLVTAGYQFCKRDHIAVKELRRNGYDVIRHTETRGDFSTNWVEVVRTDGRPL